MNKIIVFVASLYVSTGLIGAVNANGNLQKNEEIKTKQAIENMEKRIKEEQELSYKFELAKEKTKKTQSILTKTIAKMTPEALAKKDNISYSKAKEIISAANIVLKYQEQLKNKKENLTIFGIEIGKTTEKEIRNNFDIVEERLEESSNHLCLTLKPDKFSINTVMPNYVFIYVNNGIVVSIGLFFNEDCFHICSEFFEKNYFMLKSIITPYTFKKKYSCGNTIIDLTEHLEDKSELSPPNQIRVFAYTLLSFTAKSEYEDTEKR